MSEPSAAVELLESRTYGPALYRRHYGYSPLLLARRCPRNDSVRSGRQLAIRVWAQNGDAMTVTVTDRTVRMTWLAARRKLAYRAFNLASAGRELFAGRHA